MTLYQWHMLCHITYQMHMWIRYGTMYNITSACGMYSYIAFLKKKQSLRFDLVCMYEWSIAQYPYILYQWQSAFNNSDIKGRKNRTILLTIVYSVYAMWWVWGWLIDQMPERERGTENHINKCFDRHCSRNEITYFLQLAQHIGWLGELLTSFLFCMYSIDISHNIRVPHLLVLAEDDAMPRQ